MPLPICRCLSFSHIATTQLQPTDARKTFPCMDEPAIKSRFKVTLVRKSHMISISNMPIVNNETRCVWVQGHAYQKKSMISTSNISSGGLVVRAFAPWAGNRGFDPRPRHTKDVIKMVPDAALHSAQRITIGLASLSTHTSLKMWDGFHPEWTVESD